MYGCFIYRSNFVFPRNFVFSSFGPGRKQWIAKDIPSYWSQSKRAKIAIHWFGKYWKGFTSPGKNCNLRPKPWKCRSYWKLPFVVSHSFCMLSVAMHVTLHYNHILTLQRKREIHGFFNYIFATPGSCEVKNGEMPGCPELAACLKYGKRLKPKVSNLCANIPHFT